MKEERSYYVYIMASRKHGTLYVGVTDNLVGRVIQYKKKVYKNSFTAKYNVTKLVYFEAYEDVHEAIAKEKQLKKWKREWKIKIIEENNPDWKDLYKDLADN